MLFCNEYYNVMNDAVDQYNMGGKSTEIQNSPYFGWCGRTVGVDEEPTN